MPIVAKQSGETSQEPEPDKTKAGNPIRWLNAWRQEINGRL